MNCGESLWCTRYFRNSFITNGSLELVMKLQEKTVLLFPFINHSKSLQAGPLLGFSKAAVQGLTSWFLSSVTF